VCICYLDPANAARAPYLLRRIRRRLPGATAIAALFGVEDNESAMPGFRVVTTLDGAVEEIISTLGADADDAATDPSRRAGQSLEPAV
jgi:hypothetical protein